MGDVIDLVFTSPNGEAVGIQWAEDELGAIGSGSAAGKPAWELVGEVDWDQIEAIRVISARIEDGRTLAVAAIRPAGAEGHEGEAISGALGTSEGLEAFEDVRLSTHYDGEGMPQRIGLELFEKDERTPLRAAGEVEEASSLIEGGVRRIRAILEFRFNGTPGIGVYEILTAA